MMLAWPSALIGALWISPTYAIVQALSGSKLRAMGAAFFMLCVNLVGQSLGPLLVGVMSDHFSAAYGNLGLRRSEEHTSELQSLMRNSYAVFCLKNKTTK